MLTPAKAGLYLGLDVDRVRALIDKGIINGTRVGRDRKVSMKSSALTSGARRRSCGNSA